MRTPLAFLIFGGILSCSCGGGAGLLHGLASTPSVSGTEVASPFTALSTPLASGAPSAAPHATASAGTQPRPSPIGPGPSPSASLPQSAPHTTPAPASAAVKFQCVIPGGAQSLTIDTLAGMQVAYNTAYHDGHDGSTYGGQGQGVVPADGVYTASWTILATAPLGYTEVDIALVNTHNQSAFRQVGFELQQTC